MAAGITGRTSASSKQPAENKVSQVLAQGEDVDMVKEEVNKIHLRLQMLSLHRQLEAKQVQRL